MKGKHGQAASVRHEVQERDNRIAVLEAMVARLTSELNQTSEKLEQERQAHAKAMRRAEERVEAAAAPRVAQLEAEVYRLSYELGQVEGSQKAWDRRVKRNVDILRGHFVAEHGMTALEAIEAAGALFKDEAAPAVEVNQVGGIERVREMAVPVQRAQGRRQ